MHRFLKVLIATVAIAAVAAPTFAEDRLSLSGSMRVRGFYADVDDGPAEGSHAWNDQRLRVGGKINVAEGVSVNFRFDAAESDENSSKDVAWGGSTSTSFAPYSHRRADIQFDKAYLQVEKNGYSLLAGQQYFGGFGTGHILDTVGTGFIVKRGPIYLAHVKQLDSNNGNGSFAKTGFDETSLTAASYSYEGETFGLKPMVSYTFAQSTDVNRLGIGLFGYANLGVIAVKGEIDYFDGENSAGADEKGLQLYVDASTAVSETVTLGLIGLYAQGQDDGDQQVTYQAMPVFADWNPLQYGPFSTDFVLATDPFDPSENGAGVLALELYSDIKVSDDLMLQLAGAYVQTEDDDIRDFDGFLLNGGFDYALAANTSLTGQIYYRSFDDDTAGSESDVLQAVSGLTVKF